VAENFEIDEGDAVRAGERARSAGQRLQDAHGALAAVLDARNGCWGSDDIGKAVEKSYVEYADDVSAATKARGKNLSGVGDFTVGAAREFGDIDEDNAKRIDGAYADSVESWTEEK
jgi:hypothetical protein